MAKKEQQNKFSLYLRNGVYYVRQWDEDAKRYTSAKSTGQTDRDQAAIAANKIIENRQLKKKEDDPLFYDSLVEFWETRTDRDLKPRYQADMIRYIKKFVLPYRELQNYRLSKIEGFHINRLISYLERKKLDPKGKDKERENLKASVINRIILAIKIFLNHSLKMGYLRIDITKQILKKKVKKHRRGELTASEIMKLAALEWPDHRIKTAVMLGCFAGLRLNEIRSLRWRDVDFNTGYIYVRRSYTGIKDAEGNPVYFDPKADSKREFPYMIFKELRDAMLKQWNDSPYKKPDHLVLPNVWQSNVFNGVDSDGYMPMSDTAFKRNFSAMLEAIGLSRDEQKLRYTTFHSTRHAFTSHIDSVGSKKTGMLLTGHKSRDVYENYSHASGDAAIEHLKAADTALDKYRTQDSQEQDTTDKTIQ